MAKVKKAVFKPEPIIHSKADSTIPVKIPIELINVSEMTIKEIMIQKELSREGAIKFLRDNQIQ